MDSKTPPEAHTFAKPGDARHALVIEVAKQVSNVIGAAQIDVSAAIAALWTAVALGYAHQFPRERDPLASFDVMAKHYREIVEQEMKRGDN